MRAALGAAMGVLARVARSPFKGNSSSLPRGPLEPVDPTVAGDLTAADVVANAVSRAASERGSAASSPARRDERAADSSDEEGAHRPPTPKLPTPKPKAPPLEPPQPALLTQARALDKPGTTPTTNESPRMRPPRTRKVSAAKQLALTDLQVKETQRQAKQQAVCVLPTEHRTIMGD